MSSDKPTVEVREEQVKDYRSVILAALEDAGGEDSYMHLFQHSGFDTKKKSLFNYYLKVLRKEGKVVPAGKGIHRLVPREASASDIEYWLDKAMKSRGRQARAFAASQLAIICSVRKVPAGFAHERILPLADGVLRGKHPEIGGNALQVLCFIALNTDESLKSEIREKFFAKLVRSVINRDHPELRTQASRCLSVLAESHEDFSKLIDLAVRFISQKGFEEHKPILDNLMKRLETSEPDVKAEMRDKLFGLVTHKDDFVRQEAERLLSNQFREV